MRYPNCRRRDIGDLRYRQFRGLLYLESIPAARFVIPEFGSATSLYFGLRRGGCRCRCGGCAPSVLCGRLSMGGARGGLLRRSAFWRAYSFPHGRFSPPPASLFVAVSAFEVRRRSLYLASECVRHGLSGSFELILRIYGVWARRTFCFYVTVVSIVIALSAV